MYDIEKTNTDEKVKRSVNLYIDEMLKEPKILNDLENFSIYIKEMLKYLE